MKGEGEKEGKEGRRKRGGEIGEKKEGEARGRGRICSMKLRD